MKLDFTVTEFCFPRLFHIFIIKKGSNTGSVSSFSSQNFFYFYFIFFTGNSIEWHTTSAKPSVAREGGRKMCPPGQRVDTDGVSRALSPTLLTSAP